MIITKPAIHRSSGQYLSAKRLAERHGAENIIHLTWHHRQTKQSCPLIGAITQDTEIKVLIINPSCHRVDYLIPTLREQREDIFIVYINYDTQASSNGFKGSSASADLILNVNMCEIIRTIPSRAQKWVQRPLFISQLAPVVMIMAIPTGLTIFSWKAGAYCAKNPGRQV